MDGSLQQLNGLCSWNVRFIATQGLFMAAAGDMKDSIQRTFFFSSNYFEFDEGGLRLFHVD